MDFLLARLWSALPRSRYDHCPPCTHAHRCKTLKTCVVHHFSKAAPEKIEYAINRFRNEVLRVFGVLEIQLSGKYADEPREYLAGNGKGKYSIADIKTWPWVKGWERSGFTKDEMSAFPHVLKWIDRIAERPAVQRGIGEAYNKK